MMMTAILVLATAASATPAAPDLESLSAALRRAPAWRVSFTQTYVPSGLETGTTEAGTLTVVPPGRLRFDYTDGSPRIFAVDGTVARLVDPAAGTCDAVALDQGRWERLPLSALLDPAAARVSFTVESGPALIRLVPRTSDLEVREVAITVNAETLPATVTITDTVGNRNQFRLDRWNAAADPGAGFFQPHLQGSPPCLPNDR